MEVAHHGITVPADEESGDVGVAGEESHSTAYSQGAGTAIARCDS